MVVCRAPAVDLHSQSARHIRSIEPMHHWHYAELVMDEPRCPRGRDSWLHFLRSGQSTTPRIIRTLNKQQAVFGISQESRNLVPDPGGLRPMRMRDKYKIGHRLPS